MEPKNELKAFFQNSWPAIVREYDKDSLKEYEETIHTLILSFNQGGSLQNAISNILQVISVGFRVTIEENPENDNDPNYQIILHKPNEEIIPVYVTEDNLGKGLKHFHIHWDKHVKNSKTRGWKFALASNLKVWTVYGLNMSSNNPTQMSYEFVILDDLKKIDSKELKILARILLTLIGFDLKNDFTWKYNAEIPERKMKASAWRNEINQEVLDKMLKGNFEKNESLFSFSEESKRMQIEALETMMNLLKDQSGTGDLYEQYSKAREQLLDKQK